VREYIPPIESRENDELIIISLCSSDEWQQDAIDQANKELEKRGIDRSQRKKRFSELERQYEAYLADELESRSTEDFTIIEKIFLVLFWPRELFSGWGLRKEGYTLKANRRLQLIGSGILLAVIVVFWAFYEYEINNQKRIEDINNFDNSKWEKNRIVDTTKNEHDKKETNKNGL